MKQNTEEMQQLSCQKEIKIPHVHNHKYRLIETSVEQ